MNVDTQSFIKRQVLVQLALGESSNCVSTHSKGDECHLEEDCMHGTEFDRWNEAFRPVSWGSFGNGILLLLELDESKVS